MTSTAQAQRGFGGYRGRSEPVLPNTPADGRFTFVRLRYGPPTQYDLAADSVVARLPDVGERHFMKILNELSCLNPHVEETSILGFDDPDVFKYPVGVHGRARVSRPSPTKAVHFRAYLLKGGFVIFDDFAERQRRLGELRAQMLRVLPERAASSISTPRIRSFTRSSRSTTSISFRSATTSASRSSAACSRTTIRPSGCC